ncbi:polysaccharide biosynthesis/export family protein (plasmid) [Catenovulum sp. SX2]|uniref:polysaccharide biosynthesis/export family protein n=1 Tax=Catenovulum sp. SX2 TaxID=3398614 RepID=UPI003F86ACE4
MLPNSKNLMFSIVLLVSMFLCQVVFAQSNNLQVGDKLYLHVPGEVDFAQSFQIELNGKLNLPEIGEVYVEGKSIEAAQQALKLALSQVFIDLDQFYIEIKEREKIITVLGYVNEPNQVRIPDYGNVQMVLNQAKGLKPGAQLDRFQIRRDSEVVVFDYKSYLDSGDLTILPELKSGDVLFIPASPLIGNVQVEFDAQTLSSSGDASEAQKAVTLFGELHSPGTFSFKKDMTIIDALMRADGVTRYADVTKIRVIQNNVPQTFDLKAYLDSGNDDLLPRIQEGTTIYVPIMVEDVDVSPRTVYIMGEVQKPGAYEAPDNVSFLDILANAGGPTRFAETRQIRLLKESGETIQIDLQQFNENHAQVNLPNMTPGDVIFVPEKTDINEKSWLKVAPNRAVKVMGAVHHPGRYEWSDEMDLMDLLAHAGGPLKGANVTDIKIVKSTSKQTIRFNLTEYVQSGSAKKNLPVIAAADVIIVEELPHDPKDNKSQWLRQSSEKSIYVIGQVGAPGRYAFSEQMHFLDILAAADGTNSNADIRNIRVTHRNGPRALVSKVDLALYFETGDESLLPKVLPGDTLYFPEKQKNWLQTSKSEVVRLMGAVKKTGRYDFDDSMTLLDLLAEAGGPTDNAMIDRIVVVNNGGCCKEQARVFDFEAYVKNPDATKIPVLRPGDTVYVPGQDENTWRNTFRDIVDILAVVALVAGL